MKSNNNSSIPVYVCLRCGCRGRIRKHATSMGGIKIFAINCGCLSCQANDIECVYSNIDNCIECREPYELNSQTFKFSCPNNCVHESVSHYAKRFLSLSAVDINSALPPWKRTLLHSAVAASDLSLCWDLLQRGANPYVLDYLGVSPIALAASMLPGEDETNCINDKMYKSAIDIYYILPKNNNSSMKFGYIDVYSPVNRKLHRCYSEGEYSSKSKLPLSNTNDVSSITIKDSASLSIMIPKVNDETDCTYLTTQCHSAPSTNTYDSKNSNNLSLSVSPPKNHFTLNKFPKRKKHRNRARSKTHDEHVYTRGSQKLSWVDIVTNRTSKKDVTMKELMFPKSPTSKDMFVSTVKKYTHLIDKEITTPRMLDSGLQAFTSLTLARLTDSDCVDILVNDEENSKEDNNVNTNTDVNNLRGGVGESSLLLSDSEHIDIDEAQETETWLTNPNQRRPRTYSQADLGESRYQLRHWTLRELHRAVLDSDIIHTSVIPIIPSESVLKSTTHNIQLDIISRSNSQQQLQSLSRTNSSTQLSKVLSHSSLSQLNIGSSSISPHSNTTTTNTSNNMSNVLNDLTINSASNNKEEILFECKGCLEMFKSSELAFTCHRMGCDGNLCIECLYRLVVVTVSSAVYAVPIIRCSGKCRGR